VSTHFPGGHLVRTKKNPATGTGLMRSMETSVHRAWSCYTHVHSAIAGLIVRKAMPVLVRSYDRPQAWIQGSWRDAPFGWGSDDSHDQPDYWLVARTLLRLTRSLTARIQTAMSMAQGELFWAFYVIELATSSIRAAFQALLDPTRHRTSSNIQERPILGNFHREIGLFLVHDCPNRAVQIRGHSGHTTLP